MPVWTVANQKRAYLHIPALRHTNKTSLFHFKGLSERDRMNSNQAIRTVRRGEVAGGKSERVRVGTQRERNNIMLQHTHTEVDGNRRMTSHWLTNLIAIYSLF